MLFAVLSCALQRLLQTGQDRLEAGHFAACWHNHQPGNVDRNFGFFEGLGRLFNDSTANLRQHVHAQFRQHDNEARPAVAYDPITGPDALSNDRSGSTKIICRPFSPGRLQFDCQHSQRSLLLGAEFDFLGQDDLQQAFGVSNQCHYRAICR